MVKKRANGEGTAPRQRKDGRWQADYSYANREGLAERGSVTAKSKTECNAKLRQVLEEIRSDTFVEPNKTLYSDWATQWFKLYGEPGWNSHNTRAAHLTNLRVHILPVFGDMKLEKIKPAKVQEFLNSLTKAGYKPGSVHKINEPLSMSLKKAVDLGMIPSNPCDKTILPVRRQDEVKHLNLAEMLALTATLPDTTTGRASAFILMTGLRSGEIAGLRWGDINFEEGVMRVRRSVKYMKIVEDGVVAEHQTLVISPVKTRKGFREIALLPHAITLLKRQRVDQNAQCVHSKKLWSAGMPGSDEMYVFATSLGTVMEMHNVQRTLTAARKAAGLEHVTLHPLRHSALTQMSKEGTDPKTLSEIAGHEKVSFTMQTYCHSDIETKRKAMRPLERLAAPKMLAMPQ